MKDNLSELSFAKLRSSEIEMVIGTLLQAEPDLVSERLLSDRLITVMHPSLALTEKNRLPWSALAELPIVPPSGESSMRMLIERHYVRATNRPFQPCSRRHTG